MFTLDQQPDLLGQLGEEKPLPSLLTFLLFAEYQVNVVHYLNLDIQIITWVANFAFIVLLIPKAFAKVWIMACWILGILLRIVMTAFRESKRENFHHSLMQKEYLLTPGLLKDWTSHQIITCPILCFRFSAFFSQFSVRCKPLLKERQDRIFFTVFS